MAYALENALFQWEEGERRARDLGDLDPSVEAVLEALRRRLGSSFSLEELTALYAEGTDWAADAAWDGGASTEAATVVDAAFARYSREARDSTRRRGR